MGWHSDDEKVYAKESTICSVSLGQERDFQLRERADKQRKLTYCLGGGDVFAMAGAPLSCPSAARCLAGCALSLALGSQ